MEGFTSPNIHTVALDVTNDEQVVSVVKDIYRREGKIDILVNNAGRSAFGTCPYYTHRILSKAEPSVGPMIDLSLDKVKETFDTNTFSVLRTCKAVIPFMAKRKSGLIINNGSISGET